MCLHCIFVSHFKRFIISQSFYITKENSPAQYQVYIYTYILYDANMFTEAARYMVRLYLIMYNDFIRCSEAFTRALDQACICFSKTLIVNFLQHTHARIQVHLWFILPTLLRIALIQIFIYEIMKLISVCLCKQRAM